jgi:hypothetical protein
MLGKIVMVVDVERIFQRQLLQKGASSGEPTDANVKRPDESQGTKREE